MGFFLIKFSNSKVMLANDADVQPKVVEGGWGDCYGQNTLVGAIALVVVYGVAIGLQFHDDQ